MSAVVVHKSSQLIATHSLSWKGYKNFKLFKILVATRRVKVGVAWAEHNSDLVAFHTELVVNVMGCRAFLETCKI